MNAVRLYLAYLAVSLRGQMQYRGSTLMAGLGRLFVNATEYAGLWMLFDRFGSLRGWLLAEVAFCYGVVTLAFTAAEIFGRGFDEFSFLVRRGDFDLLLLRPRSTVLQVAAQQFPLHRLGRGTMGLAVLVWSMIAMEIAWTPWRLAVLAGAIVGGACVFLGLFILQATLSFWTIETLEIMNTVTYGGVETAQYPLSIYKPWFRRFFTWVVPLGCVTFLPATAVLGRVETAGVPRWLLAAAPMAGPIFLFGSLLLWRVGVRHYRSTGS